MIQEILVKFIIGQTDHPCIFSWTCENEKKSLKLKLKIEHLVRNL